MPAEAVEAYRNTAYWKDFNVQATQALTLDESVLWTDNAKGFYSPVNLVRTLSPDYWNTFCVPFDIDVDKIAEFFGEGTEISVYTGVTEGNVMKFQTVEAIKGGVPYLIKPSKQVVNPVFENVTITAAQPQTVGTDYSFVGIYGKTTLLTDGTHRFVSKSGSVSKPTASGNVMNGIRAYFIVPKAEAAKQLLVSVNDDVVTSIDGVVAEDNAEEIYDLNGRKMKSASAKGIYIVNGRKVVVK